MIYGQNSLVPRPLLAFHRLQYSKAGRAWYLFSHEHVVIGRTSRLCFTTTHSSALRHHHIAYDIPEPDRTKMPKLKLVNSGISRTKTRTPKQIRLPVTPDILRQVYKHWYSSRHDYETIMLWSASTLCFFGFFRRGELLSPTNTKYDASSHLSFQDVAVDSHSSPSLVKIHLKTSKTDQE